MSQPTSKGVSRRSFLRGSGAAAAASTVVSSACVCSRRRDTSRVIAGETSATFKVNGKSMTAKVEPRTTIAGCVALPIRLDRRQTGQRRRQQWREHRLGRRKAGHGVNDFALWRSPAKKSRLAKAWTKQFPKAFVEHDAQQCGFCTPGFVVAVRAFVNKHPDATVEQIRAGLNGNICRCGTYANVLEAVVSLVKGNQNG